MSLAAPTASTWNLVGFLSAGKGVHIVTVNDYLARRDAGWCVCA